MWKQCLEWLKTEWSGGKVTLNTMFALCPKAFEAPCSEIWKSLCHSQETEAADITCGSDAVFITNSNYQLHIPGCTFWVTISKCPHNIAVIGLPTLCVRCCTSFPVGCLAALAEAFYQPRVQLVFSVQLSREALVIFYPPYTGKLSSLAGPKGSQGQSSCPKAGVTALTVLGLQENQIP